MNRRRFLRDALLAAPVVRGSAAGGLPVVGQQGAANLDNDNSRAVEPYLPWWRSVRERGAHGFDEDPLHVVIPELNNVRRLFAIDETLERNGFSGTERELILGRNWTRVLSDALG